MEVFHPEAILGFAMLVMGTLLYNEIVVLPICGLDQNTGEKLAERAHDEDDCFRGVELFEAENYFDQKL